MLRTKQNLALICFSHFHMFASKLSINDKTACLKTWFSCGRTRSFHYFLESSRSFSFFYPEPFICEKSVLNSRGQWSAHRGGQSNRQPYTGLPAERRTPLFFLISSRSFSVSFLGLVCCFCNRFEVVNGRTFIKICQ